MRKVLIFFGPLTDDDVEWLTRIGRKQVVKPGVDVMTEGVPSDFVYVVLAGQLSVLPSATGGREIARIGSGETLGEISFVDSRPPSATVRARAESVLLAIPKAELGRRLRDDPPFAGRFYRALAVYLANVVRRNIKLFGTSASLDLEAVDQETRDEADELDPEVLDHVHLAGARFDRMLKKLL